MAPIAIHIEGKDHKDVLRAWPQVLNQNTRNSTIRDECLVGRLNTGHLVKNLIAL